jgi:oligopeptide/dipeptide ABC transporter ATP-binding protein
MGHLLEARNLTIAMKKESGFLKVVKNAAFHIDEGEIVGIAGETGCGKSMLTLSIPGLMPQKAKITGGEIVFNGRNLVSLNEEEMRGVRGKEISVIFQDVRQSLNPLIKAGRQITETLALGGSHDKNTNRRRAIEMLHQLGFADAKLIYNAYPHQLSGGMCQRVMTAIAAINRPRLLLADEPSSALDADSQERILSLLMEMNRKYKTAILIVSHDLSIIREFASRFLVMYAGRIVEEGPSSSLFSPLHPYTKALIGAIPHKEKKGQELENIPGKVPSVEDELGGCPFAPRCKKAQEACAVSFPPEKEIAGGKVHCFFPLGETNG